jgi:hypothetical protein
MKFTQNLTSRNQWISSLLIYKILKPESLHVTENEELIQNKMVSSVAQHEPCICEVPIKTVLTWFFVGSLSLSMHCWNST